VWHTPVLAESVADLLVTDPDALYVDGTIGSAGHALTILTRLSPRGRLWGFDWDPEMIDIARERIGLGEPRVELACAPLSEIPGRLSSRGEQAQGILADLGLNSVVLDRTERGFRYRDPAAPLDMRMDRRRSLTAATVLNEAGEAELEQLFREAGEVRRSRAVARAVVTARGRAPLRTAGDLLHALRRARVPAPPAELSRIYQALRYRVNAELEDLDLFLAAAASALAPGGRLVVLSYESITDRRVKTLARAAEAADAGARSGPHLRALQRRVVKPAREEVVQNPRARSARLRALERKG
jgi:16S rRNA (cytosine1402-N4)-methyltransferase